MKKVFLITMYDAETLKYIATYNAVFATKELAQKVVNSSKNNNIRFVITKVNMYLEEDYVE